jgi:hypothetical protein
MLNLLSYSYAFWMMRKQRALRVVCCTSLQLSGEQVQFVDWMDPYGKQHLACRDQSGPREHMVLITQRAKPLGHHVRPKDKSLGRPEFRLYEPQAKSQVSAPSLCPRLCWG